ncbi:MAG: TIGR01459 family HAD-type hydrolase [Hyphomicrobiaceae bacterium]
MPRPTPEFQSDTIGKPQILLGAGDLLSNYDVLFCDVWGVMHDGLTAYQGATHALQQFRKDGGTVILVSNAPVPKERVARMLELRNVPTDTWDEIVSSGDLALRHISDKGYNQFYNIGPPDRDAALFSRLPGDSVALDRAHAIVATGFNDDVGETAEDYRALLEKAKKKELPFVCANPDKYVDVGGKLYLCAGAIADLYEEMDGEVFWAGKPHASTYHTAHQDAEKLRDDTVAWNKILVIGDALRTDLVGAQNVGLDALFVAGGIHRDDVVENGLIVPDKLEKLFNNKAPPALGAMAELRW